MLHQEVWPSTPPLTSLGCESNHNSTGKQTILKMVAELTLCSHTLFKDRLLAFYDLQVAH